MRKDDEIPVRKIGSPSSNTRAEEFSCFAMQRNADFSSNIQRQFPRFETTDNSPAKERGNHFVTYRLRSDISTLKNLGIKDT